MFLWLETEPLDITSQHEEMSGVLTDIDDLMTRTLMPTQDDNIRPESLETQMSLILILNRPESPEASDRLTTTLSPTCQGLPPTDVGQSDIYLSDDD